MNLVAERIVTEVLADLDGRQGFDLLSINRAVLAEMKDELIEIVENILEEEQ